MKSKAATQHVVPTNAHFFKSYANDVKDGYFMTRTLLNPIRQAILTHLMAKGEATVTELVTKTKKEQSIVSQHLGVLRRAGLVKFRRAGKNIHYSMEQKHFDKVTGYVQTLARQKAA